VCNIDYHRKAAFSVVLRTHTVVRNQNRYRQAEGTVTKLNVTYTTADKDRLNRSKLNTSMNQT